MTLNKRCGFAAVIAACCAVSSCEPAMAETPTSAVIHAIPMAHALPMPAPDALLMMIRSHVLAVGQANATGNYEVLRGIASARFQALNTADALAKTFTAMRDLKLDLSPVAVSTPVLSDPPAIVDGMLRLVGAFPTQPIEVPFGLLFEADAGLWRLNAVSVGARPAVRETALALPLTQTVPAKSKSPPSSKKEANK